MRRSAQTGAPTCACTKLTAIDATAAFRRELAACFESADIVLTPTAASLPWPLDRAYPEKIDGRDAGPRGSAIFGTFVNAGGLPAVIVTVAPYSGGQPIGKLAPLS